MVLIDELGSGVAPAATPQIARDLGLSPGAMAGAIITAFHGLALLVEAPLLAWADRGRVRTVSALSLAVMGAATLLAGVAPGPAVLFVALTLYGTASGCALSAAEGTLVESRPDERERTMTRLTLAGVFGDLSVPALLAALAALGLGWRTAMGIGAAATFALAVVHARSPELDRPMATAGDDDDEEGDDEPRPPLRELLRVMGENPRLVMWSIAGSANGLMDEVLVAFAVVHLDAHAGATPLECSLAIGAWTVGDIVGLVALDRLLKRFDPMRLLTAASAVAFAALVVFVLTHSTVVASAALAVIGVSAVSFHPLMKARAYAALPGRPAMVNAVASLLVPVDALAPLALAAIAARHGSTAAVAALLIAPVGVGLASLLGRGRGR